jgi:hypothetical protein
MRDLLRGLRLFGTLIGSNSPRPVKSTIYGYLQRWPCLFCGRIVAEPVA